MTLTLGTVIFLIVVHFIADFVFQDVNHATQKSKSKEALTKHVLIYTAVWYVALIIWMPSTDGTFQESFQEFLKVLMFCGVTAVFHWCTDYVSSKITARQFAAGRYGTHIPNLGAFTTIGLDQVAHHVQLLTTYAIIFG